MKVKITKLKPADIDKVKELVATVIQDSFQKEGAVHKYKQYMAEEISRVQEKFSEDKKADYYFLIAKINDKVVGTAGFGFQISKPIKIALTQIHLPNKFIAELMSFYVHPEYQEKGTGSKLLQALLAYLKQTGCQYFSLYTGYQKAGNFWKKKLGEPQVVLPKYFEDVADCNVWIKPITK